MTRDETIWLAGLLEGEGCFHSFHHARTDQYYPTVSLVMTDRDVVERAAVMMGGCVVQCKKPRRDGCQPSFKCQKQGWPAVAVMRAILPWMGERRSTRIRELIEGYEGRPTQAEQRKAFGERSAA